MRSQSEALLLGNTDIFLLLCLSHIWKEHKAQQEKLVKLEGPEASLKEKF